MVYFIDMHEVKLITLPQDGKKNHLIKEKNSVPIYDILFKALPIK